MPTFNGQQLYEIAHRILVAAGASVDEADVVATELKKANLVGHDSHGVMRLMQYVDYVERGYIKPGGTTEVLKDLPAFSVIDGHFNFGQVVATNGLEHGLQKARSAGAATVVFRNCNHVGRLGSYSQQAALQGFAAMMAVNGPASGGVAPFGGIQPRMGTNPISAAAPWADSALVLDMTTSATAEGKLRVAFQKGERVPEGMIIDAEGNPTTDPADFYADPPGAVLPLGGPLGFKGYGLSVMIDVFAGVLSGSGVCRTDLLPGANGVWMYLIDVEQFLPRNEYDAWIEKYVAHIKSSRRQPGVDEILLPGEIEQRRLAEREQNGVPVPDETWRQICELAEKLSVSLEA